MSADSESVDRLNAVGVLTRREIELRVIAPIVEALGREFGRDRVLAIVGEVIASLAREQGRAMAGARGDASLATFAASLEPWTRGDAMRMEVVEQSPTRFAFNVTRCRYAEMYRELGSPELGAMLSCARDAALIEGFNPDIVLTRTETIMQGGACCDFRYERRHGTDGPRVPGAERPKGAGTD